jgi:hypothetical protein
VPRRVGDDELALLGGEVAVRHVDGDALLALGREPVGEQREVDAAVVEALALLERGELVLEDHARVVEQAADERGLAVVHRADGDEAAELLAPVLLEVALDVRRDQVLFVEVRHQK